MKKRLTALLLALVMVLALTACGGGDAPAEDEAAEAPAEEAEATATPEPTEEPTPTPVPTPAPTPEPAYRLAKIVANGDEYTFAYDQGGYLPTEVFQNGESYATATYDEAGRFTSRIGSSEREGVVYNERGDVTEYNWTMTLFGSTMSQHVVIALTYDDAGNCTLSEETVTDETGKVYTGTVIKRAYDEAGNCIREEETMDLGNGPVTEIAEYTYDEAGRKLTKTTTRKTGIATYTYSEDGQTVTATWDDGDMQIDYNVPLLDVNWHKETYHSSATVYRSIEINLFDTSRQLGELFELSVSSEEPPELTYDENGYLVKAVGSEGDTIELTYEPVA